MAMPSKLMTADELLRMRDDNMRHELIAGVLTTMPLNGGWHGILVANITCPLGIYVDEHDLGATYGAGVGCILTTNPDTVRAPDGAFLSRQRDLEIVDKEGYLPGAPDLAIEVIDYGEDPLEVREKIETWLRHGSKMVIAVNVEPESVTVYRSPTEMRQLGLDDVIDGEEVVPGWRLPVRELFE